MANLALRHGVFCVFGSLWTCSVRRILRCLEEILSIRISFRCIPGMNEVRGYWYFGFLRLVVRGGTCYVLSTLLFRHTECVVVCLGDDGGSLLVFWFYCVRIGVLYGSVFVDLEKC